MYRLAFFRLLLLLWYPVLKSPCGRKTPPSLRRDSSTWGLEIDLQHEFALIQQKKRESNGRREKINHEAAPRDSPLFINSRLRGK